MERFNWETLYRNEAVEKMPWFNNNLDKDLAEALKRLKVRTGDFLDLGTGPGTQAARLSELGFRVTGSDLSKSAINKARKLAGSVRFVQDNILNSRLPGKRFDYIFDRGCFHTLQPSQRKNYVNIVKGLLNEKGILFLKCFSARQTGDWGPYRFSKQDIRDIFGKSFEVESIRETTYEGTLSPHPKALFAVMKNKLSDNR